jgi:hypothetical protein
MHTPINNILYKMKVVVLGSGFGVKVKKGGKKKKNERRRN